MTSDEESLEKQKSRQIDYIHQIERQMYKHILHDGKDCQRPWLHELVINIHAPRLRKLHHHAKSILRLLNIKTTSDSKEQ